MLLGALTTPWNSLICFWNLLKPPKYAMKHLQTHWNLLKTPWNVPENALETLHNATEAPCNPSKCSASETTLKTLKTVPKPLQIPWNATETHGNAQKPSKTLILPTKTFVKSLKRSWSPLKCSLNTTEIPHWPLGTLKNSRGSPLKRERERHYLGLQNYGRYRFLISSHQVRIDGVKNIAWHHGLNYHSTVAILACSPPSYNLKMASDIDFWVLNTRQVRSVDFHNT